MPRNLRQKRRDKGRPRGQPIVDAVLWQAINELSLHGPDDFSVERVADRAKVNKTSVYRRWPTKGALLAAALNTVQQNVVAELPDTGSLRSDLKALGLAIAGTVDTPMGRGLLRAVIGAGKTPELAAFASEQIAAGMSAPAGAIIQRAILRGEFPQERSPGLVLSILAGSIIHRIFLEQQIVNEQWIENLLDLICIGIGRSK